MAFLYRIILIATALIVWLFGAIVYAQIFFFEEIHFYSAHVRMLALAIISTWWISVGTKKGLKSPPNTRRLRTLVVMIGVYVLCSMLMHCLLFEYTLSYLLFAGNVMLFFVFLLLFAISYPTREVGRGKPSGFESKTHKCSGGIFIALSVPIVVLGVLQYFMNQSILPQPGDSDYFKLIHTNFIEGGTRASSIFTSGWAFGEFATFVALISLGYMLKENSSKKKTRVMAMILYCICGIAVYATLTRVVYIQFVIGTIGLVLITKTKISSIRLSCLSIMGSTIIVITVFYIALYALSEGAYGIVHNESIYARLLHWKEIFDILEQTPLNFVFGTGLIANERFAATKGLIVDNLYLSEVLYWGVPGLVLFLLLIFELFLYAVKEARFFYSPFWLAFGGFLFSVPSTAFFTDQHNTPILLAVLVFAIAPHSKKFQNIKYDRSIVKNRISGRKLYLPVYRSASQEVCRLATAKSCKELSDVS